jgi:disulfide oxidoreductase YuzD
MLWMSANTAVIDIIGAPAACAEGVRDTWREVAGWAAAQLSNRFGAAVQVRYFDLFDPGCPPLPGAVHLPLVMVNGEVLTSGGKISVPVIRRRLSALGVSPDGH